MARYTIAATRGTPQSAGGGSWGDRAFHPNRRVGPDNRPSDESYAEPKLTFRGHDHRVDNLNWLTTNKDHVERVDYNRSPATDWEAIMQVSGTHPEHGNFEFEVGWRDRNQMRDWVGRRLPGLSVDDHLRDGGY